MDPHQPSEFQENRFKTTTCGFGIKNLKNEKRNQAHLPNPTPPKSRVSEKPYISFQNIAEDGYVA